MLQPSKITLLSTKDVLSFSKLSPSFSGFLTTNGAGERNPARAALPLMGIYASLLQYLIDALAGHCVVLSKITHALKSYTVPSHYVNSVIVSRFHTIITSMIDRTVYTMDRLVVKVNSHHKHSYRTLSRSGDTAQGGRGTPNRVWEPNQLQLIPLNTQEGKNGKLGKDENDHRRY
jgi:hypothetical protein